MSNNEEIWLHCAKVSFSPSLNLAEHALRNALIDALHLMDAPLLVKALNLAENLHLVGALHLLDALHLVDVYIL